MPFLDELQLLSKNWTASLAIGVLVASWWRGTWVLFDLYLCNQPEDAGLTTGDSFCFAGILEEEYILLHRDTGWQSLAIGYACTFVGVTAMWAGLWEPKDQTNVRNPKIVTLRVLMVYILGMGCLNTWRGFWYLTDYYLWPDKHLATNDWGEWPLGSYWLSSVVGSSACFLCGAGAALLACPGIFYIDGPGIEPPPVAVALMSSYYSRASPNAASSDTPAFSPLVIALDMIGSFIVIPFFVVWFWRGSWMVLDFYLYEFSPEASDVWQSIGYSAIIALLLLFVTSNTVFDNVRIENYIVLALVSRLRTYVLAWGVVNYWRSVWLFWDEATGTKLWSCWFCHIVPLFLLLSFGCMSSIMASDSTLDIDFSAPDRLCTKLPIPADNLFVFGIGRNPPVSDADMMPNNSVDTKKTTSALGDLNQLIDVDVDTCIMKKVEMSDLNKSEQEEEHDV